jgi:hypothetical protein
MTGSPFIYDLQNAVGAAIVWQEANRKLPGVNP